MKIGKHTSTKLGFVLLAGGVLTLVGVAWAGGYLREQLIDEDRVVVGTKVTYGTFTLKNNAQDQINGNVTRTQENALNSSYGYKHVVPQASHRRAELDNDDWHYSYRGQNIWYGFSYWIPKDTVWDGPINQYVGQFRFINYASGNNISACSMYDASNKMLGGSGHHLVINNNKWILTMVRPRAGIPSCSGLEYIKSPTTGQPFFDLGGVVKGDWVSFIIQAKWRHTEDGEITIWRRDGRLASWGTPKLHYVGRNWFDTYQTGSWKSDQQVAAPNWTVGLYAAADDKARTLYSDELRMYAVPTDLDKPHLVHYGWKYVEPNAPRQPVNTELNRSSTTTAARTTSTSATSPSATGF